MADWTRRSWLKQSIVTSAVLATGALDALAQDNPVPPQPSTKPTAREQAGGTDGVQLAWLETEPSAHAPGATWGVPWPTGERKAGDRFVLRDPNTLRDVPIQTWPTAYWPDGSVKWTAHAAPAAALAIATPALVVDSSDAPATQASMLLIKQSEESFVVDNGLLRMVVGRTGDALIHSIERGGKTIVANVRLVAQRNVIETDERNHREHFKSRIDTCEIEQQGEVRSVIKLTGMHAGHDRAWLPFVVRLYVYQNSDAIRLMHSFIFDGDQNTDFISGLGVTADVPMQGAPMHDRHIRFAGADGGLWAEAVRNLSGLRRDPGKPVIEAQIAGRACPPTSDFAAAVRDRLQYIPAWGEHTLRQLSPDAFEIRKRAGGKGVASIHAANGLRAAGLGYVGTPSGGLVFGLRDFWQRYPTQLDIKSAETDFASVTLWMYSPDAAPMDLRGYHDGLGQDTFEKQYKGGLEITYEDWEPGFSEPYGIARTSELMLWAVDATPPRTAYADYARAIQSPPLLVCRPERYQAVGIFGGLWGMVDRSTEPRANIEDALDRSFDYYAQQREQHRWYGFWDYGDVMHTYDAARHTWRYDVGGYAWDNSELSPDLWLWYTFLRTGRADVFRFAEAMTRHTGEVDVYHIGKWKGLGSRHNVLHWGCSAKQLRISTAVYRRFYYYLTGGDERVGDLMRSLIEADQSFLALDPIRKIREGKYEPQPEALAVGFGTDWGSLAVAWLTEFERTRDQTSLTKLTNGMRTIGAMPHGFFSADARYNLATGEFSPPADRDKVGVSHLSAVFGLVEICAELINTFPDQTAFRDAWLQYCTLYNAPREERKAAFGGDFSGNSLTSAHSRLTAYAAKMKNDPKLAARAWREFMSDSRWAPGRFADGGSKRIVGPDAIMPLDEMAWVSTNDTSQWGLTAIENLHLIGDTLPADLIK